MHLPRILLEAICAGALLLTSLGGATLPKYLFGSGKQLSSKGRMLFHMGNVFSGGAMLGAALCDLIPDSMEILQKYSEYPVVLFMVGVGYIVTLGMEILANILTGEEPHHYHHHHDHQEVQGLNQQAKFQPLLDESSTEDAESHCAGIHSCDKHIEANYRHHYCTTTRISFTGALLLAIALSYHSVLAGGAIGSQETQADILKVLYAVLGHKGLEAYALGSSLVGSEASSKKFWLIVICYSVATPLGIFLGYIVSNAVSGAVSGIFGALAAGTFLFIAANEIIGPEMRERFHTWEKVVSLVVGFLLMAALPLFFTKLIIV